jgi:hypothetical protein
MTLNRLVKRTPEKISFSFWKLVGMDSEAAKTEHRFTCGSTSSGDVMTYRILPGLPLRLS